MTKTSPELQVSSSSFSSFPCLHTLHCVVALTLFCISSLRSRCYHRMSGCLNLSMSIFSRNCSCNRLVFLLFRYPTSQRFSPSHSVPVLCHWYKKTKKLVMLFVIHPRYFFHLHFIILILQTYLSYLSLLSPLRTLFTPFRVSTKQHQKSTQSLVSQKNLPLFPLYNFFLFLHHVLFKIIMLCLFLFCSFCVFPLGGAFHLFSFCKVWFCCLEFVACFFFLSFFFSPFSSMSIFDFERQLNYV